MKFDEIISEIGQFGPYQKKIYFLICLSAFPNALQTMITVFTVAVPNHRCAIPGLGNDTYHSQGLWHDELIKKYIPTDGTNGPYKSCDLYKENSTTHEMTKGTTSCSHYVYDTDVFESTVVSEFDLVCEDKLLKTYASMFYMGGVLLGSLVMGPLSDAIGRKKVMLIGNAGILAAALGVGFAQSYLVFAILRLCTGFFCLGLFLSAFVIGMELVGPNKRTFAGIGIQYAWTVSLFIFALMAYFIRDWRILQIASTVPTVVLFVYAFYLPESPRWLISQGKVEEARAILETAANGNNVTLHDKVLKLEDLECDGAKEKLSGMFTHKTLRTRTLIVIFNWVVATLVFYGLGLNVGALSGDIHLNFTISTIVEGIAYGLCGLLLDRTGRKPLQCISMLIAGVACLGTMIPVIYGDGDVQWLTVTLSMIGKFGGSAAFAIIYLYSAELFPTTTRNSVMGICSFTARIGAIAAPYIADLGSQVGGHIGVALPVIIFGTTSLLAGLFVLWLPETNKEILPEDIEDAKQFGMKMKEKEMEQRDDENNFPLSNIIEGNNSRNKEGIDNLSLRL